MIQAAIDPFAHTPDIERIHGVREAAPYLFEVQAGFVTANAATLATMEPRFYQHDVHKKIGTAAFTRMLGPDVDHALHPFDLMDVILKFGLPERFLPLALVHDWGEIHSTTGDIQFGNEKGDAFEQAEKDVRAAYIRTHFGREAEPLIRRANGTIDNPDIDDGRVFKIGERIGYLRTIFRAYRIATGEDVVGLEEPQRDVMWSIASNALFHLTKVEPYFDRYPAIGDFMEANADAVKDIQDRFKEPITH